MGARKNKRTEQYEYTAAAKLSKTSKHSASKEHTKSTDNERVKQKPCTRKERERDEERQRKNGIKMIHILRSPQKYPKSKSKMVRKRKRQICVNS